MPLLDELKSFSKPTPAETKPLCESCGYDLTGILSDFSLTSTPQTNHPCPECAREIATSLPSHRQGSPWQRKPSIRSWISTNWRTLRHPTALFSQLIISNPRSASLATINSLLAAFFLVYPWAGTLIRDPMRITRGYGLRRQFVTALWAYPTYIFTVAVLFMIATSLEYYGIRFIAGRRGWRLTRAGAWQICCHATIGWLTLALLPILALATLYSLRFVVELPMSATINLTSLGLGQPSIDTILTVILPVLAIFAGIFWYEYLVHLGVRQCRYAAAVEPLPPTSTVIESLAHPAKTDKT